MSRSTSWQALLFDFDGTLAELNIDFAAMRADLLTLLRQYDVPEAGADHLPALETIAYAEALLTLRDPDLGRAFSCAARQRIEAIELEAACRGRLFPDTRELLAALAGRGIGTAIVTRNCGAAVRLVFPDIDLCCGIFLPREDTARVKPDPGHLNLALAHLKIPAVHAAMIGDHPMDMRTARLSGTTAIGVLSGRSPRESLLSAGAHLILVRACQIEDFLPSPRLPKPFSP